MAEPRGRPSAIEIQEARREECRHTGHYWAELHGDSEDPIALVCVRCSRRVHVTTQHLADVVALLDAALFAITRSPSLEDAIDTAHAALSRGESDGTVIRLVTETPQRRGYRPLVWLRRRQRR